MKQVAEIEVYPRGSKIVHIGPPKTGTTAVQSALFRRKADLAAYGVDYPGQRRHERAAVSAVAFEATLAGYSDDIVQEWARFSREARGSTADRVFVSSESFSRAPDARLSRIVEDLGGPDLQIVVTMRPLGQILPSRWQQQMQDYQVDSYSDWLERLFATGADADPGTAPVWRRYRVDRLIRRWGAHVGEENITVVVLDPEDRSMLLGTFERLLGLPAGFLEPVPDKDNLSLPWPEAEMLRAFNRRFRAEGHDRALYVRSVRRYAKRQIKVAGQPVMPSYPIETPAWAVERANEVVAEMTAGIRASGARVIGDLAHLIAPVRGNGAEVEAPTRVAVDSAAEIAYAMFLAGRRQARKQRDDRPTVDQIPARDLARVLLARVIGRLGGR